MEQQKHNSQIINNPTSGDANMGMHSIAVFVPTQEHDNTSILITGATALAVPTNVSVATSGSKPLTYDAAITAYQATTTARSSMTSMVKSIITPQGHQTLIRSIPDASQDAFATVVCETSASATIPSRKCDNSSRAITHIIAILITVSWY